jgi:hypothetical protein
LLWGCADSIVCDHLVPFSRPQATAGKDEVGIGTERFTAGPSDPRMDQARQARSSVSRLARVGPEAGQKFARTGQATDATTAPGGTLDIDVANARNVADNRLPALFIPS